MDQSEGTAAMTIRSKTKGVKEEPIAEVIGAEGKGRSIERGGGDG